MISLNAISGILADEPEFDELGEFWIVESVYGKFGAWPLWPFCFDSRATLACGLNLCVVIREPLLAVPAKERPMLGTSAGHQPKNRIYIDSQRNEEVYARREHFKRTSRHVSSRGQEHRLPRCSVIAYTNDDNGIIGKWTLIEQMLSDLLFHSSETEDLRLVPERVKPLMNCTTPNHAKGEVA
jgi:hypothetical protein